MAVVDKNVVSGNATEAVEHVGAKGLRVIILPFEVDASDDNGSVYRLTEMAESNRITNIKIGNDALTNGNDFDIGFYEADLGPVVIKDILADGLDLSSSHLSGAELSGISNVDVADRAKKIWELLGKTQLDKNGTYDLAITANAVGDTTGTILAVVEFVTA